MGGPGPARPTLSSATALIVHRSGRIIAQVTESSISAAERGKLHNVLASVIASGQILPHSIVYPRKRAVSDACKCEALP